MLCINFYLDKGKDFKILKILLYIKNKLIHLYNWFDLNMLHLGQEWNTLKRQGSYPAFLFGHYKQAIFAIYKKYNQPAFLIRGDLLVQSSTLMIGEKAFSIDLSLPLPLLRRLYIPPMPRYRILHLIGVIWPQNKLSLPDWIQQKLNWLQWLSIWIFSPNRWKTEARATISIYQ